MPRRYAPSDCAGWPVALSLKDGRHFSDVRLYAVHTIERWLEADLGGGVERFSFEEVAAIAPSHSARPVHKQQDAQKPILPVAGPTRGKIRRSSTRA